MKKLLRYLLLLSITMFCVMFKPDNAYAYGGSSGNFDDRYENKDEIYEDHRDETGQSGSSNNKYL